MTFLFSCVCCLLKDYEVLLADRFFEMLLWMTLVFLCIKDCRCVFFGGFDGKIFQL